MDDKGLLDRACRGDEVAFSELFARYQGSIYRYAVHMCGRDAGDDVVQETFLALLRQNGRYDASRGPLLGYLFGIARHHVVRHLASSYEYQYGSEPDDRSGGSELAEDADVLEHLTRAELVDAVRTAVQSLPPPYREAVVLCYLQDMDYATAAGIAGCPVGTIRSRLHRARSILTTKLAAMQQPVACVRKD